MLYLNNGWTSLLKNLEYTLPIVCLYAPLIIYDMVQQFSLSGYPLLITLKSGKCPISTTDVPGILPIWNPLSLWYVSMLP